MTPESLKSKFAEWVFNNTQVNFPNDTFLNEVLNEKVTLIFNTTYNKVPAIEYLSEEELMKELFQGWKSSSLSFLKATPGISINLRGVPVPSNPDKINQLRNQVLKLEALIGVKVE